MDDLKKSLFEGEVIGQFGITEGGALVKAKPDPSAVIRERYHGSKAVKPSLDKPKIKKRVGDKVLVQRPGRPAYWRRVPGLGSRKEGQ